MRPIALLSILLSATLIACSTTSPKNSSSINLSPIYPPDSRQANEEGIVLINVLIGKTGDPIEVQLYKSSGFQSLDNAAIAAVKTWRFTPAKNNEQTIEAWFKIPIKFELNKPIQPTIDRMAIKEVDGVISIAPATDQNKLINSQSK